jgi:hypothetical protein
MIHQEHSSIARASKLTGIPYDNAKAINRTYLREKRVQKINYRMRYHHKKNSLSNSSNLINDQQKEIENHSEPKESES